VRILYAVQGTGNGHLTRAREVLPALSKRARVDLLISGMHSEIEPDYPVSYRLKGLGFKFGKKGGVDVFGTWWHGDIPNFFSEVNDLSLRKYDLVINDFEPVSARAARAQHVPCIGLSNQCVLTDRNIPLPQPKKSDALGRAILKHYAPVDVAYGFYYMEKEHFITTPIIRTEIRQLETSDLGHYLVYLPFYHDAKITKALRRFPSVRWKVFSKHATKFREEGNVSIFPIDSECFMNTLASARGVISGAGFGMTTEVLFLGKKLLVVPMKNQFEQRCNAHTLSMMGVPVIKSLKKKWHGILHQWLSTEFSLRIQYPDATQALVDKILTDFAEQEKVMGDLKSAIGFTRKTI